MARRKDATNTLVETAAHPLRIVSLVPSTTETLFVLGVGDRVVGVTRFCVHPQEARRRATNVGGTKSPRLDQIEALQPDLIFANLEENRREDVEALRNLCPVYVAFPKDVPSALDEIVAMGELVGAETNAARLVEEIRDVRRCATTSGRFRFLYLVWRSPYLAASRPTFIDALLSEVGGKNAAPASPDRYPQMTPSDMSQADPDVIFLSSEPFPFTEEHTAELVRELGDPKWQDRIRLVDGELLSWHGARLREGLRYAHALAESVLKAAETS